MEDKVCSYYLNGNCKYGKSCRFLHKKICLNYSSQGHCPYGSRCRFLHQAPPARTRRTRKINEPCRYFLTEEGCHKGDDCRFLHEFEPEYGETYTIEYLEERDIEIDDRCACGNKTKRLQEVTYLYCGHWACSYSCETRDISEDHKEKMVCRACESRYC